MIPVNFFILGFLSINFWIFFKHAKPFLFSSLALSKNTKASSNNLLIGLEGSSVNKIPDENLNTYFYDVLFKDQIILDNLYDGLIKIINENELKDIVSLIRSKSEDYHTNVEKESIDILHIDGNHDEEYVTKDILFYLPLVKKGGYIIMDDITWPGVINSITNHLEDKSDLLQKYEDFAVYVKK